MWTFLPYRVPTGKGSNGRFDLFVAPPGNVCYLRTTAIDHRQTMAAFPAICRARATCSALDFASLPGPIQRESSRPTRMFPPSGRQAGTDD